MWQQVHFDHRKENQKMAIKLDIIEQRQGVKFESTALNGLRGLAAFHVLVFHSIEFMSVTKNHIWNGKDL